MSDTAVRIENLGKLYRIAGGRRASYRTIQETLISAAKTPFQRMGRLIRGQAYGASDLSEPIWALKDINLEIKHGEVIGVIGRNGAGKSTLLKILSQITEPTEGYAEVYGRVGSLLEVGTAFHPELSGRENVYLNGAILGMSRKEIDRKFDEIVDFAEIEKFIDTPLKHYSSGMGLRLGFAVAAHLPAEILLIDEILAVGDQAFQRKCLNKMGEVSRTGRTILFVSHNMATVVGLTTRCVVLDRGQVEFVGETNDAVRLYAEKGKQLTFSLKDRKDRAGSGSIKITDIAFYDAQDNPVAAIGSGEPLTVRFDYETKLPYIDMENVVLDVVFTDVSGAPVATVSTRFIERSDSHVAGPYGSFYCTIPSLDMVDQTYFMTIWLGYAREHADYVIQAAELEVVASNFFTTGHRPTPSRHGFMMVKHDWSHQPKHELVTRDAP